MLPEHAYYIELPAKTPNVEEVVDVLIQQGAIDVVVLKDTYAVEIDFVVTDESALFAIKKLFKVHTIF